MKKEHIEFVKPVPNFLAKMGLTQSQQQVHEEKRKEATIEDKFKPATKGEQEEEKETYDFENAQIEDLANMLQGGPLASEEGLG